MAAKVGNSSGGPSADINMTPMIDIMLVLLIIFMVVQQGAQKGLAVQVPPVKTEDLAVAQQVDQIVLEVQPGHQFLLNQQPIPAAELVKELKDVFDPRPRKVIFVKGAETVSYGDVVFAVDAAKAAGLEIVGLVPRT
jgi:biopolymer transport protein ExbD